MGEATRRLVDVSEEPRPFRRDGLGYIYDPPGTGVRLRVDYIEQGRGDLSGEIVAESIAPGVSTHLLRTRMNMLVAARLTDLGKQLAALVPNQKGWDPVVRAFCEGVIQAEREGEPFVRVGSMPTRMRLPERVERILVEGKPTLLYGPGGAGKGYLATGIAEAVQSGRPFAGLQVQQGEVLYLDWEDDADEADERIKEVARGLGLERPVDIHYRVMRTPLHHAVNRIAQYVAEHRIRLLIVDSLELAAGGAGDRGTYEEVAKRFFLALRQIGPVSSLLVDHVSEAARQNKQSVNKAYGAIFKANWSRRAFEVKYDQTPGEKINHVGLYVFKTNRGEVAQPLGIAIDFTSEGRVAFRREDIRDNPQLRSALPAVEQIAHALRSDRMLPATLAEVTGLSLAIVKATLNLQRGMRYREFPDKTWGLLDRPAGPTPVHSVGARPRFPDEFEELTEEAMGDLPF